jgi:hypothetical protein
MSFSLLTEPARLVFFVFLSCYVSALIEPGAVSKSDSWRPATSLDDRDEKVKRFAFRLPTVYYISLATLWPRRNRKLKDRRDGQSRI